MQEEHCRADEEIDSEEDGEVEVGDAEKVPEKQVLEVAVGLPHAHEDDSGREDGGEHDADGGIFFDFRVPAEERDRAGSHKRREEATQK